MQVSNSAWTVVVPANNDKFIVQNVGDTRIGFAILAAPPATPDTAPSAIVIDSDEHGQFLPGQPPITLSGINTDGNDLYVRSLGPKAGQLFVV